MASDSDGGAEMTAAEFLAESKRIEEAATPIVRSGLSFGWVEWSADGPQLCGPAIETALAENGDC